MVNPKNILITGATGFIGACLVHRLIKSKDNIHLLLKKSSNQWRIKDILDKVNIHYLDLNNAKDTEGALKKVKPQIVYHLAACGDYLAESREILETAIFGSFNLLNACLKTGFDVFVNTGSSSEYGTKNKPMSERDPLESNSYYATTKAWQTLFCQHLGRDKQLPIITLRPFSVYGPYEMSWRLIPTLIKNCLQGRDLTLVSPKTARDFVFVDDVVSAFLKAGRSPKLAGHIFNIGSGKQSTVKDIVAVVVKETGAKVKQNWGTMPGRSFDTNVWLADISKAEKMLKWQPKYNLEEGLKKTVHWFKKHSYLY